MRKSPKFSPELIERAVRLVYEAKDQHPSQWQAICSVANKIGCNPDTLRKWIGAKQAINKPGDVVGHEAQRIKALEREVHELRRTNEILKAASAFFARAEFDRQLKK